MRLLLIILIALMSSCELIVDVDVPYDGDKMVVNAVQAADSTWYVDITSTKNILDPQYSFDAVLSANVVIHKPDGTTETLVEEPGSGIYRGISSPEAGKDYKITVSHSRFETVEASMKMPRGVKIKDVVWDSLRAETNGDFGYQTNVPFTLSFDDPQDEVNFYDVNVFIYSIRTYNRYPDGVLVTDTLGYYANVYLRDPAISDDDQSEFDDRTFDGKATTIPFIAELQLWGDAKYYKTEVYLTTMSEELLKYTKTARLQSEVSGDPFAQPVQVFSNMSNNYGIFAGSASDVKVFKAPKQP